jgi:tRNA threonylcarbamoyladenosine biosynthesis protein TsaB
MRLLAYDLSTIRGSIALVDDEAILCGCEWPNDRRNSSPFFSSIHEIITKYGAPEMIVVGLGPGSYTGTRIAISAGIGLQATTGATLAGISSLCAVSNQDDFYVIGDARRASFFLARIKDGVLIGEPELLCEAELTARITSITNASIYSSDELPQFHRMGRRFPCAKLLCSRARTMPENLTRAPLVPIYLREPHITTPQGSQAEL